MARPASTAHFTALAHIKPNAGSRELIARGSGALMLCEATSNRLTLKALGCRTSLTASIELQRRRAPPSSSVHAGCSVCPLPPQRRHCPRPVSWLSFLRTKRAALRGNGTPRRLDLHPRLAGRGACAGLVRAARRAPEEALELLHVDFARGVPVHAGEERGDLRGREAEPEEEEGRGEL
jgi:hypothetical protein